MKSSLSVIVQNGSDPRRIKIDDRADALVLCVLVKAGGAWIAPQDVGMSGASLSRHSAALRRRHGIKVETETVQDGGRFHNKHRLRQAVVIETDLHPEQSA